MTALCLHAGREALQGMAKRLKRPRDLVQLAKLIGDIATGQVVDGKEEPLTPAQAFARSGGLREGKARADRLTAEQRRELLRGRRRHVGRSRRWRLARKVERTQESILTVRSSDRIEATIMRHGEVLNCDLRDYCRNGCPCVARLQLRLFNERLFNLIDLIFTTVRLNQQH